jgi:hypothetical protein
MTGTELQGQIQRITNDTNTAWSPTQYLEAINYAITYVSQRRAIANDAEFVFPLSIVNGQDQPADFIKFAGTNPIEIRDLSTGGRKWYYTGSTMPTVKYYRNRPQLTSLSDTVQLNYKHCEAAKLAAAIYLKEMRGTYDMSKEKERLEVLLA